MKKIILILLSLAAINIYAGRVASNGTLPMAASHYFDTKNYILVGYHPNDDSKSPDTKFKGAITDTSTSSDNISWFEVNNPFENEKFEDWERYENMDMQIVDYYGEMTVFLVYMTYGKTKPYTGCLYVVTGKIVDNGSTYTVNWEPPRSTTDVRPNSYLLYSRGFDDLGWCRYYRCGCCFITTYGRNVLIGYGDFNEYTLFWGFYNGKEIVTDYTEKNYKDPDGLLYRGLRFIERTGDHKDCIPFMALSKLSDHLTFGTINPYPTFTGKYENGIKTTIDLIHIDNSIEIPDMGRYESNAVLGVCDLDHEFVINSVESNTGIMRYGNYKYNNGTYTVNWEQIYGKYKIETDDDVQDTVVPVNLNDSGYNKLLSVVEEDSDDIIDYDLVYKYSFDL